MISIAYVQLPVNLKNIAFHKIAQNKRPFKKAHFEEVEDGTLDKQTRANKEINNGDNRKHWLSTFQCLAE